MWTRAGWNLSNAKPPVPENLGNKVSPTTSMQVQETVTSMFSPLSELEVSLNDVEVVPGSGVHMLCIATG